MNNHKGSNVGIVIALSALVVNMPRLVILFLQADGIEMSKGWEGWLLGISGVATGIVLSGGGAYIAHTVAQPKPRSRAATAALMGSWIALLFFTVVLLAPSLVLALQNYGFAQVLKTEGAQWLWSIVAVVSVEVLAAGAMVAHAVENSETATATATNEPRRPGLLSRLAEAATDVAVAKMQITATATATQPQPQPISLPALQPVAFAPQPPALLQPQPQPEELPAAVVTPQPPAVVAEVAPQPQPEAVEGEEVAPQPKPTREERLEELLARLQVVTNPRQINRTQWAAEFGVSRQQISDDLELIKVEHADRLNGAAKFLA